MLEMYDFSVLQCRHVLAAMNLIALFRPDAKAPADVSAMIPNPDPIRDDYVVKKTTASGTRDARHFSARDVHDVCVDFLAQATSVYRKNHSVLAQLGRIVTEDKTFSQTLTRGDQTSALWGTLPQIGTPPANFAVLRSEDTVDGKVLKAELDALITAARAADVALPPAEQAFQKAEALLHQKHALIDDFVTAALVQGRSQFAPGSPEREVIDAIPTEPAQNPPGQAVITSHALVDATHAKLVYDAPGATSFDVLYQSPMEEGFNPVAQDIVEKEFIVAVVTGDNTVKVVGKNSRGSGPESDVATVTA